MTTIEQMHPRFSVGFQSDAATAANAALWAAQDATRDAQAGWRAAEDAGVNMAPLDEADALSVALRHSCNRAVRMAEQMAGLVSSSACGLWFIADGRVGQVESTDGGSDYLRGVTFEDEARDDFPVLGVVAFFDSEQAARDFLNPPRRFPFS